MSEAIRFDVVAMTVPRDAIALASAVEQIAETEARFIEDVARRLADDYHDRVVREIVRRERIEDQIRRFETERGTLSVQCEEVPGARRWTAFYLPGVALPSPDTIVT